MKRLALLISVLAGLASLLPAVEIEEMGIPIPNSRFDYGNGEIVQQLVLDSRDEEAEAIVQELGDTGWFAKSQPSCLDRGGIFHPGIAIYNDRPGAGLAIIRRQPRHILPHLRRFCQSETWMWVPLPGVPIETGCSYTLGIDVDTGHLLDSATLAAQGFGIGLATGSTAATHGKLFVDSQRLPTLLEISVLRGTNHHISITFVTGADVPTGDLTVVIFATKAPIILPAEAIQNYRLDNVSLSRRRHAASWPSVARPTSLDFVASLPDPQPNRVTATNFVPLDGESALIPAAPEPSTAVMALLGGLIILTKRPSRLADSAR